MKIQLVNNRDRAMKPYIFGAGAYGHLVMLSYAFNLEDALDDAINYIAENHAGMLCNDIVEENYEELREQGYDEDEAWELATEDTYCSGSGDYINSWEWSIIAEDPTPKQIADLHHGRG